MNTGDRFYVTSGTIPADALSYVSRDADTVLLQRITQGEFCFVLCSRQMGKSSLMTQVIKHLRCGGGTAVIIDLTTIGSGVSPLQWYNGLIDALATSMNLEEQIEEFARTHPQLSPLQLWQWTLRELVLETAPGNTVIFVDEIDKVQDLDFSTDEFFAAIRACFNARAEDTAFNRLTFCLLGVAAPEDLIRNPKLTPFNIGRRIELEDFTRKEVTRLEDGLGQNHRTNRALMDRIYYWTGGHPSLTQKCCEAVSEKGLHTARGVDDCVEQLFLSAKAQRQDGNLPFVPQRIIQQDDEHKAALLTLYSRVKRGREVIDRDTDPLLTDLKLAGIVRTVGGRLKVRNRIYDRIFDQNWINEQMPGAEKRRQQAAYRRGVLRTLAFAGIVVFAMAALSTFAIQQRNRAEHNASREKTARAAADAYAQLADKRLYLANMNLIQREWEANNVGHVMQLLEEVKDNKNKGFEWGYWNRLCHLDLITLNGHDGPINSISFSPDGKSIVTGSDDRTAIIWDAVTGRKIRVLEGNSIRVRAVAFSPNGKLIVTATHDNQATVCDSVTGRISLRLTGRSIRITSVIFSADGKRILAGGNDNAVMEWDAAAGRELLNLPEHKGWADHVAFSHDGKSVVTGSADNTARLWDAERRRVNRVFKGHTEPVLSCAISRDGKQIATGSLDNTARIWDAISGGKNHVLKGHTGWVDSVAFSRDGKFLVTGSEDGTARVWDTATGREMLTLKGHTGPIRTAAFSPDGTRIVTGSVDKTAKIWDAVTGLERRNFHGHSDVVTSLAFSPNGKQFVSGSGYEPSSSHACKDNTAKVWDAWNGRESITFKGHTTSVTSVAGTVLVPWHIVTGSWDGTAKVWDPATGRLLLTLQGHEGCVKSVAFSPNGQTIATGGVDKTAKLWDAASGHERRTLLGHAGFVTSIAFSPNGKRVVTGSYDKTARIWDPETGRELLRVIAAGPIFSVSFSSNGRRIVTGGYINSAVVWNASTGDKIFELMGHSAPLSAVIYSPDGKRILTSSSDYTTKVWDSATGRETLTLRSRTGLPAAIAISPDGRRIVMGSGNAVTMWFSDPQDWKDTIRTINVSNMH